MLVNERKPKHIICEVENDGLVAAGRVVPFPAQIQKPAILALLPHEASMAERGYIRTMTVNGNSLEDIGIFDGDSVIVKKAFNKREITSKTVCIVYIPANGEVCAKRVRFAEGRVALESCNRDVPPMFFHPDDIEIRGIVIGMHRTPDVTGSFAKGRLSTDDIPF